MDLFQQKSQQIIFIFVDCIQGASLDPPGDVGGGGDPSAGGVL